jgi:hypothetical protein
LILAGLIGEETYRTGLTFYHRSDSLSSRLVLWDGMIDTYLNAASIPRALFGLSVGQVNAATEAIVGSAVSVESEYLRIYLTTGLIGLSLFLWAFLSMWQGYYRGGPATHRTTVTILPLCVLLMSVVMTGVIFYAVYALVTLTVLAMNHQCLVTSRLSAAASSQPTRLAPRRALVGI